MSGTTVLVDLKESLFSKDLWRISVDASRKKFGKSNTRNDRLAASPTSGVLAIFGHL